MLDQVALRILEITLATQHKVDSMDRKLDSMARRRSRGSILSGVSPKLIRWFVIAFLLAGGHMTVPELKWLLGLR